MFGHSQTRLYSGHLKKNSTKKQQLRHKFENDAKRFCVGLKNQYDRLECIFLFLFVFLSCAHPIFMHKITIHSFFAFFFVPHQLFFSFHTVFNIFWPHQLSSIKLIPLLCVHRHSLFICNFSEPCSVFVCLFF